jgi:hypothetical protein
MLIIVDGPNGAGKSTFVRRLIDEIKVRDPGAEVERFHRGPPTSHPLDEYERPLLGYRPGIGRHVICERWHVGELVYPGALGRPTQMNDAVFRHIELFLRSRGAFQVHVTHPNDDVIVEQFTQRDRVHGQVTSEPLLRAVIQSFRERMKKTYVPTMDCTNVLADDAVCWAVDRAEVEEKDAARLNPFTTYVGDPDARVLLLGDVRSGDFGASIAPAFGPYPATSGEFLLGHIPTNMLRYVGIANACDVDDAAHLASVLRWGGRGPRVVTLGRAAERCVGEWLDHPATVPHPQYVRRFFHARGPEYGEMIEAVANGGYEGGVWWRH